MRLNTLPCKCLLISTLVLVVFLLAACEKELPEALPDGMLHISAEALTSGSKAVVDGVNSTWQDGDRIRFSNVTLATVTLNGNGNFYISSDGIASGTPVTGFLELFDRETAEAQTQESWSEHGTWDNSGDNFF